MARGRARGPRGYVVGDDLAAQAKRARAQGRADQPGRAPVRGRRPRLSVYRPRKVPTATWDRVRAQAVALTEATAEGLGLSDDSAYDLLRVVAGISVWWTAALGRPWDPDAMLTDTAIDTWTAAHWPGGPEHDGCRGSARSQLRRVADHLRVPGRNRPQPYSGRTRNASRTDAERAGHYMAARALPEPWRTDAVLLLDSTYHTGLSPHECEALAGAHVTPLPDGCSVLVPAHAGRGGPRPARTVHVLGAPGRRIAATAAERGPGLLLRPGHPRGGRSIEHVVRRLRAHHAGAGYDTRRAASAWAARLLGSEIPFAAVAAMAGWAPGTKTPTELLPDIEVPGPDTVLELLRRTAS